ncbi:unnamed protein product [Linum trigynum]|uniref:Uncharacterized protein n=1 Tax=Linum trigynum TaxID=586398 RepID=A0AAV2E8X5_9ROSI
MDEPLPCDEGQGEGRGVGLGDLAPTGRYWQAGGQSREAGSLKVSVALRLRCLGGVSGRRRSTVERGETAGIGSSRWEGGGGGCCGLLL